MVLTSSAPWDEIVNIPNRKIMVIILRNNYTIMFERTLFKFISLKSCKCIYSFSNFSSFLYLNGPSATDIICFEGMVWNILFILHIERRTLIID